MARKIAGAATETTILIDVNLDGYAELLAMRLATDGWRASSMMPSPFSSSVSSDIGLDRDAKDNVVWRLCQERGYYLLTANRNEESGGSRLKRRFAKKALRIVCRCADLSECQVDLLKVLPILQ